MPKNSKSTSAPVATSGKTKSTKSPSTLRRLIDQAEKTLAKATETQDAIMQKLADAGSDHQLLATLSAELAVAQSKVSVAEENWLVLAAEAEEIGL